MIFIFTPFMDFINARHGNVCPVEIVKNEDPLQRKEECDALNDSIVGRGTQ
jgi:hypothetical protein